MKRRPPATEHALLEDNGDGVGTRSEVFDSDAPAPAGMAVDGHVPAQMVLVLSAEEQQLTTHSAPHATPERELKTLKEQRSKPRKTTTTPSSNRYCASWVEVYRSHDCQSSSFSIKPEDTNQDTWRFMHDGTNSTFRAMSPSGRSAIGVSNRRRWRDYLFTNTVQAVIDDISMRDKAERNTGELLEQSWPADQAADGSAHRICKEGLQGVYSFNPDDHPGAHNCVTWVTSRTNEALGEVLPKVRRDVLS